MGCKPNTCRHHHTHTQMCMMLDELWTCVVCKCVCVWGPCKTMRIPEAGSSCLKGGGGGGAGSCRPSSTTSVMRATTPMLPEPTWTPNPGSTLKYTTLVVIASLLWFWRQRKWKRASMHVTAAEPGLETCRPATHPRLAPVRSASPRLTSSSSPVARRVLTAVKPCPWHAPASSQFSGSPPAPIAASTPQWSSDGRWWWCWSPALLPVQPGWAHWSQHRSPPPAQCAGPLTQGGRQGGFLYYNNMSPLR